MRDTTVFESEKFEVPLLATCQVRYLHVCMLTIFSRSYCCTLWSAIGIIISSVCLYVTLCISALGGSVYMANSCTSVFLAGKTPYLSVQTLLLRYVSFSHKATKHTEKRIKENANVSFLRQTIGRALVVLRSILLTDFVKY